MRRIAIILALMGSAQAADLVGTTVPPFPDGLDEQGGSCIGPTPERLCERGVGILIDAAGKQVGVYTGTEAGHRPDGRALWRVTDQLPYPKLGKGQDLIFAQCRHQGVDDGTVMAVVRRSKLEWLPAVSWAYRVDGASGKFVKLDPKGVDCVNEALDGD